jgi:DNA polymerase-3 subunit gamma/tau
VLSSLHRIAVCQVAPNAIDNSKGDQEAIRTLAQAAQPEDVHLFYQIGVQAGKEMALAPTEQAGFEMALLRMLAFSPSPAGTVSSLPHLNADPITPAVASDPAGQAAPAASEPEHASAPPVLTEDDVPPWDNGPKPDNAQADALSSGQAASMTEPAEPQGSTVVEQKQGALAAASETPSVEADEPVAAAALDEPVAEPSSKAPQNTEQSLPEAEHMADEPSGEPVTTAFDEPRWPDTDRDNDPLFWWQISLHKLGLSGMARTIFAHSQYYSYADGELHLLVSTNYRKVMNATYEARLTEALPALLPDFKRLKITFGTAEVTPQLWLDQLHHSAWQQAVAELEQDPFVQTLVRDFGGELQKDTVKPTYNPLPTGA